MTDPQTIASKLTSLPSLETNAAALAHNRERYPDLMARIEALSLRTHLEKESKK